MHTAKPRCALAHAGVRVVLALRAQAQIGAPVVEAVTVNVVNLQIGWRIHDRPR
jgi:hypothetical protein